MPRESPCPFRNQPANEGGHIDASIGEHGASVFQFSYTPVHGTDDHHVPCAFRALSQQALTHQKIDRTQACRRCARMLRVHSINYSTSDMRKDGAKNEEQERELKSNQGG